MEQIYSNLKKQVKRLLSRFFCSDTGELLSAIQNASVVSFDIFDTLIKRDVPSPADVHILVGKRYLDQTGTEILDYPKRRLRAEQDARRLANGREITLKDIFDCFPGLAEDEKSILYELEIQTEYDVCCVNSYIKPVYDAAIASGKKIVITSDMYLPEDFICNILKKCSICEYEKLYLSSAQGVTKSSGKLFDTILADMGCEAGSILHIGDNIKGDYYRARQKGFKARLIATERQNLDYWKKNNMKIWEQQLFYSFLNNHKPVSDTDFARNVGYEVLGPMLYGFAAWLHKELEKIQPDRVFFLSREGALLQQAYNLLYPDSPFPQEYLYVSRQAVQVPLIGECKSYPEMLQLLKPLMHTHSLEAVGKSCHFDNSYEAGITKLGLHMTDNVFELPADKQESYFRLVLKLGKSRFDQQRSLIRQYLCQIGFCGKVAVVDIGWQGTMQKALMHYSGEKAKEITGFYLGVRNVQPDNVYQGINRHGYLFEPNRNIEWDLKSRFTTELLETLFLSAVGSVREYSVSLSGATIPVLDIYEQKSSVQETMEQIQKAAQLFLHSMKYTDLWSQNPLSADTLLQGYESFAVRPTMDTICHLKEFYFTDAVSSEILPPHSSLYYFLQPWKLFKGMNASACKILFLKDILKLPLPYYEMLKFLLLRMNIKSQYRRNMEYQEE